ncbi:MAG TPA: endonuclease [Spirochaetota bacterium]|nr:endonuclease [Spirochaetota bacterium]
MTENLNGIYRILRKTYGKQGWWPILNADTGLSEYGGNAPLNEAEIFEIAIGAILTQNVAWKNVEKALLALKKNGLMEPVALFQARDDRIAKCIISSGYYNQKTKKIKNFLTWFREFEYSFEKLINLKTEKIREEMLGIKGIGPETADSILLYGLGRKIFVIDAYTKRIFSRLGFLDIKDDYEKIRKLFEKEFKGDTEKYNEYHALIVLHGKDCCKNNPLCSNCCLNLICPSFTV